MAGRTDIVFEIRCRTDLSGYPWAISASSESGYFDSKMFNLKPCGQDVQDFMDYTDEHAGRR